MDIRPTLASALSAFGVDATITPPSGSPVAARVFWLPPAMVESPTGSGVKVVETQRVLVLGREFGAAPRGSVVAIPEFDGEDASTWRVDSIDSSHHDHVRAVVVAHVVET